MKELELELDELLEIDELLELAWFLLELELRPELFLVVMVTPMIVSPVHVWNLELEMGSFL